MKTIIFESAIGKTITSIEGLQAGSDDVVFRFDDGDEWKMYHSQDCCESVRIEEVIGEVDDLLNSPLLQAEEVYDADFPPPEHPDDSYMWTFYKFATAKGYVTIRWLGQSNGYYGESVSIWSEKEKKYITNIRYE